MSQPSIRVEQMDPLGQSPAVLSILSAVNPLDFGLVEGEGSAVRCLRLRVPDGGWNESPGFTDPVVWVENADIPGHAVQIGFSETWTQNGASIAFSAAPGSPMTAVRAPASWNLSPGADGAGAATGYLWLRIVEGNVVYPDAVYGGPKGRLRVHVEGGA